MQKNKPIYLAMLIMYGLVSVPVYADGSASTQEENIDTSFTTLFTPMPAPTSNTQGNTQVEVTATDEKAAQEIVTAIDKELPPDAKAKVSNKAKIIKTVLGVSAAVAIAVALFFTPELAALLPAKSFTALAPALKKIGGLVTQLTTKYKFLGTAKAFMKNSWGSVAGAVSSAASSASKTLTSAANTLFDKMKAASKSGAIKQVASQGILSKIGGKFQDAWGFLKDKFNGSQQS